jgi:phosphoenolpyruvate carboxykinase (ATP)
MTKEIMDNKTIYEQARKHGATNETEFGGLSHISKIQSRSAAFTKNRVDDIFDENDKKMIKDMKQYMENADMIVLDRIMGEKVKFRCRLIIPRKFIHVANGWAQLLKPAFDKKEPDFTTVDIPDWKERKILVEPRITWIGGTDYIGEIKKSFLRMWMYEIKQRGGLGLHAGSKKVVIDGKEIYQLYLGLSATGKSTLTVHGFGSKSSLLYQDDVVGWMPDGSCIGTENEGIYTKTECLTEDEQPEIYQGVTSKNAVLENIYLENKKVDFGNLTITSNGRAAIKRADMNNVSESIDAPRVDQIFFLTRNPLVPPIVKLDAKQGAAFFMLGESIETSAGDPSKAGQAVRVVGTNPFIMGSKGEEGNKFLEMMEKTNAECFLLNTGGVGEGNNYKDISLRDTISLILQTGSIEWKQDVDWLYLVPKEVKGVDMNKFNLKALFKDYEKKVEHLRQERLTWLNQFPELKAEIAGVLAERKFC